MTLRTSRLLLRDLEPGDAHALNEIERDPRVTRYTSFDPRSLEETREHIERSLKDQAARPRVNYDLAVVPIAGGTLIGRAGVGISRAEHKEAALWYELSPGEWGKGYATEAATAVLDFAFGELALHRIWADCDPRNTASCRVAQRLGMTREGHLRENWWLKGEWCSTALYAILDREWAARSQGVR